MNLFFGLNKDHLEVADVEFSGLNNDPSRLPMLKFFGKDPLEVADVEFIFLPK